jgi:putative spermidine/putrescine transport system ATP-binding protein
MNPPVGQEPRSGAALRLERLTKRFGPVFAAQEVCLDIPAGSFVTLLGPSGSGKTTTLNLLAGFLLPDAGEIFVDGQAISRVPPYRRNIGMVFQHYALFPHMTVFENVAFPLRMRSALGGTALRRRVEETLDLVQLAGLGARYPRQLSGGQQQRVAMARALVSDPRLLLMDEPLGALDKKLRERLQLEIKAIHRRVGATIVYVTHDQSEALTLSDLVVVMDRGRVLQVGSPRALYEAPKTGFVADFLGGANLLSGQIAGKASW